jgi:hypothetical protein
MDPSAQLHAAQQLAALQQLQMMSAAPAGYPQQYAAPQAGAATSSGDNMLTMPPPLRVCVEGIPFTYQLTEEDLLTVFRRFGQVTHVSVHPNGNTGAVQFLHWPPAMQALSLHKKELQGLTGSHLLVEVMAPGDVNAFYVAAGISPPAVSPMVAALSQGQGEPQPPALARGRTEPRNPGANGARPPAPAPRAVVAFDDPAMAPGDGANPARKFTCRFEVGPRHDGNKGISNYKVASKMIHFVAVPIWKANPEVKTRVRGRGSGFKEGPRKVEANEPLQLCISCSSYPEYQRAVQMGEAGLAQIQNEYWNTTGTILPVQKFEQPIFDRPEKPKRKTEGPGKGRRTGKKADLERAQTSPSLNTQQTAETEGGGG